ncbi:adenosylcobinamide amidohydrolase [Halobaculum sp. P14]|uniref:adenosylcobinamide amidohydrolase n=1 Tax=Halobaculum sp. P14 TaxID=3421638 RepID=UPI003EBDAF1C
MSTPTFEATTRDGVLRLRRPGTRWLSTGWDGGFADADAAYNVTVPDGWHRDDLAAYVDERLAAADFDAAPASGPVLLTGVDQRHARGARCGPVEAVVTAGVSNPAALPMTPAGGDLPADSAADADADADADSDADADAGTVNVVVGTTRALGDAALANLVAVAAEAKTATLLHETGFPGTTTDAVVVATDPDGEPSRYSGSATRVGAAARACVRDALQASLDSRYRDAEPPRSVEDAEYGVETAVRSDVFVPGE